MNIIYELLTAANTCVDRKTNLPPNFYEELEKAKEMCEKYAKSKDGLEWMRNALKILYPFDYERMSTPEMELKKRLKRKKARNKRRGK